MRDFDDFFRYVPKGSYRTVVDKNGNYYECWCNDSNRGVIDDIYKHYLNKNFGLGENKYYLTIDLSSRIPEVHHILINGDTTTFIWEDGTHTIVKLAEGEEFDLDTAYCYAIVKKITGNTGGSMKRYFDRLHKKTIVKQEKSSPLYDKLKDLLKYLKKD